VSAAESAGALAIELPAANTQHLVFDAARQSELCICGLHPERSSLEAMFMAAIRRQGAA
jgi:hypothetical protein